MTKYRITYRKRPLGLNPKYLDKSAMPQSHIELEGDSLADALNKYAHHMHTQNIERTGYTYDIIETKEIG